MPMRRTLPLSLERHLPEIMISGLLLLLYTPLLWHWYDGWLNKSISIEHEYFSHGLIGFPFAAYIVWSHRQRWQQLPNKIGISEAASGLALLSLGVVFYLSNLTDLINLSLPIVLAGGCLWLKGKAGIQLQAFPLLLVLLATPTEAPYLLAPYTLPLQEFIASMAGFVLVQFGMQVRVDQIYLLVNDRIVEVAPYCAGLKMLFTSLYVGLMLLYWTGAWTSRAKVVLLYSGIIVISTAANVIRNALLTFFHGTGREDAFHWLHDGWGGDTYSACMLGLLVFLVHWIDRGVDALTATDDEPDDERIEDSESASTEPFSEPQG